MSSKPSRSGISPSWAGAPACAGRDREWNVLRSETGVRFRSAVALAQRDLLADWRRWSMPERVSALGAAVLLASGSILALSSLAG